MSDEEEAATLDGSGYARGDGESAAWANSPGGSWTIVARLNAAGLAWFEKPATIRNDGLEVAADAITVTLR